MADKKISQLTGATTPLAGTEVLPIVQGGSTVKVPVSDLTAGRVTSAAKFVPTANDATGDGMYLSAADTLAWSTAGTLRMRLNSSGLILQDSAAVKFSFVVPGSGERAFLSYTESTFTTRLDSDGPLEFAANNAVGLTISSSGNATLQNGNLVVGTAAKGIDFSANTHAAGMTSELLNWYEEGTWTGTLTATTPPTTPVTATGRYTRIGRQVTVNIEFDNKNTTGASGAMSVTGLPFTAGSAGYGPTMKNSMGVNVITATVSGGGSSISFSDAADMTNFNIVAAAGIYLRLSVTYFV